MPHSLIPAVLNGLLSGALFVVVYGAGLGFIFMFLPTLPLFFAGLRYGPGQALRALGIGALLIALAAGLSSGIVYLLLLALPSWYLARCALRRLVLGDDQLTLWFPIGQAIAGLSLYATGFIALMGAYYAGEPGGLGGMISRHIAGSLQDVPPEYNEAVQMLAGRWNFLLLPVTVWLWACCLYGHAWLANRALVGAGRAIRPHFGVRPFSISWDLLYLLAVSALASVIGGESMRFIGKVALLCLSLPYFFAGAAFLHVQSARWPSRGFFLFFVYFSIVAQVWPALLIAALGLWQQLKTLNKRLPEDKTSSKN